MLVAAIKSGNPLAGKAVVFNEADNSFSLTGLGAISAAELLAYEDRGLLEWADFVTREWALETAGFQARAAQATEAAATATAAAATAAVQAAAQAAQLAAAEAAQVAAAELDRIAPKPVVYEPPSTVPLSVQGIPAIVPGFELGAARKRPARWVVFSEPAPGEPGDTRPAATAVPRESFSSDPALLSPAELPPAIPLPLEMAPTEEGPGPPVSPDPPPAAAVAGRRGDRRLALRAAERRREMAGARIRIALYVLVATFAAVILFLVQRGGL